jgi:hypothetical protein
MLLFFATPHMHRQLTEKGTVVTCPSIHQLEGVSSLRQVVGKEMQPVKLFTEFVGATAAPGPAGESGRWCLRVVQVDGIVAMVVDLVTEYVYARTWCIAKCASKERSASVSRHSHFHGDVPEKLKLKESPGVDV